MLVLSIYYELEVLKDEDSSNAQFGFAQKDSIAPCDDDFVTEGFGDNNTSWSLLDGRRGLKSHGDQLERPCQWWVSGNIIGLAANIDKGMIAVSKDGDWTQDILGVVFQDASIKKGVYPCFSTSDYQLRYCFNQDGFKYGPPTDSVWDVSE